MDDDTIGTLFIEITGEEIGIIGSHTLHDITHRALTRRKSLANLGDEDFVIQRGDRIAQLVVAPVVQAEMLQVDALDDTVRGTGGFGSTGI